MKKFIIILLFLLPTIAFSQTAVKDTVNTKRLPVKVSKKVVNKVVLKNQELDEEYTERPFKGEEEKIIVTPYIEMTDHEEYNAKLKKPKK